MLLVSFPIITFYLFPPHCCCSLTNLSSDVQAWWATGLFGFIQCSSSSPLPSSQLFFHAQQTVRRWYRLLYNHIRQQVVTPFFPVSSNASSQSFLSELRNIHNDIIAPWKRGGMLFRSITHTAVLSTAYLLHVLSSISVVSFCSSCGLPLLFLSLLKNVCVCVSGQPSALLFLLLNTHILPGFPSAAQDCTLSVIKFLSRLCCLSLFATAFYLFLVSFLSLLRSHLFAPFPPPFSFSTPSWSCSWRAAPFSLNNLLGLSHRPAFHQRPSETWAD